MDLSSVLMEPLSIAKVPQHMLMGRTFSPVHNGNLALIQVMNISPTPLTIHQGTKLGEYTPLADLLLIDSTCPDHLPSIAAFALTDIDLSTCELSPTQQQQLLALLQDYADLFATAGGPLGRTSIVRHAIYTDEPPIRQPMCCQPVALRSAIDSKVQKMLQQGVIQPSFSPWSSPVVMVKKRMGPGGFVLTTESLMEQPTEMHIPSQGGMPYSILLLGPLYSLHLTLLWDTSKLKLSHRTRKRQLSQPQGSLRI